MRGGKKDSNGARKKFVEKQRKQSINEYELNCNFVPLLKNEK